MNTCLAGAARICIDPPLDAYPFPTNFCLCGSKYDSCYVRAAAIGNGERTILFAVYELSDIPSIPDLEVQLAQAAGIAPENVILAVTHNHSAPNDRSKAGDYPEKFRLFQTILLTAGRQAAAQAVAAMRPARFGFGKTQSWINVNRDLQTAFGFWVEGPNYAGYSNRDLSILKFEDMQGKLITALMNYGAHAVCAFLQPDEDGIFKTSGNFPGIACRFVEETFGGDSVAIWTSGAAGNQDPILFDYTWQEFPDGYVAKIPEPDGTGYRHMEALGRMQGADAVRCLRDISAVDAPFPIAFEKTTVSFPSRRRVSGSNGPLGFRMGGVGPRTDFSPPKLPEYPEMEPDPDRTVDYALQVLRLGDTAVILTSGELYAEIARDMMAAAPVQNNFVVTHIPGGGGYTLDKHSIDHKTFQAFGSIAPGITDEVLTAQTAQLVRRVFSDSIDALSELQ